MSMGTELRSATTPTIPHISVLRWRPKKGCLVCPSGREVQRRGLLTIGSAELGAGVLSADSRGGGGANRQREHRFS